MDDLENNGKIRVNLFHYATSELSQDAFFAWLMQWASPEAKGLMHEYGVKFIRFIFDLCGETVKNINSLEVIKQGGHIDIQCRINGDTVILIEDKVGTKQHSDQLARYRKLLDGREFSSIIPLYIKTRDQSDYEAVKNEGYSVITRADLLDFFHANSEMQRRANNHILNDFVSYMEEIEESVLSYRSLPPEKWHWNSWIGFYQDLQRRLREGHWDYVANPSGGFLGYWWHFIGNKDGEQYLQLEEAKLCFKIDGDTQEQCRSVMYEYRDHFIEEGKKRGINIIAPQRLRAGRYTTVAVLGQDYRVCGQDGVIDMDATVAYLSRLTSFLDQAMDDFDKNNFKKEVSR